MAPTYTGTADASGGYSVPITSPLALDNHHVTARQSLKGSPFGAVSDPLSMVIAPASPVSGTAAALHLGFAEQRYFRNGLWVPAAGAFSFARASSGTYFDAGPSVQSAAADALRLNHDPVTGDPIGALLEGARTNLAKNSRDLDASGVVSGGAVADDGIWQTLTEDTATTFHRVVDSGYSVTSGTTYTLSRFVQYHDLQWVFLLFNDGANPFIATFDILNGVVGQKTANVTSGMVEIFDGAYLIWITGTSTSTYSGANIQIGGANTDTASVQSYTGASRVFRASEAQFEAASFPSSRIRTTSASATRAADALSITPVGGLPFEGFDLTKGTMVWEARADTFGERIAWSLYVNGSNFISGGGNGARALYAVSGGVNVADLYALPTVSRVRVAAAWSAGDFAASVNGAAVLTDTSGALPVGSPTLHIGSRNGNDHLFGSLEFLTYYPERLSNAELVAMAS